LLFRQLIVNMLESTLQIPSESPIPEAPEPLRDQLERLFVEVTGLANQLKKTSAALHRSDNLPACGQRLLQILKARGPQSVPGMARLSLTSRQNVQIAANRLKTEGWIKFQPNPAHKRSVLVCLTEQGQGILSAVSSREETLWKTLLANFSAAAVESLITSLRRLRQALSEAKPEMQPGATPQPRPANSRRKVAPGNEQAMTVSTPTEEELEELPVSLL
jgi:DNA-binding MarR family transcriptional regulator